MTLFKNSKNNRIDKKKNNLEFIKSFDLITTVNKLNPYHLSICHLKIHFISRNILFNLNGNDDINNFLRFCEEHFDGDIDFNQAVENSLIKYSKNIENILSEQ